MTPTKKLDVLVVDDDKDNADSMAMLVELWGHDVRIARDGKTALAFVDAQCPDAVLLDVGMPGMSGIELATRLTACAGSKRPLLVAVTGFADPDTRGKMLKAGAQMHLVKPVVPAVLQDLLERHQAGRPPEAS